MTSRLLLIVVFLPFKAWSQQNSFIQRSSLAVHLIANHFLQHDSLHLPNNTHRLTPGLALSFLKGITPRLDFQATIATSYAEFGKQALGEFDVSLRSKILPDNPRITPFLQAGAGLAKYTDHFGAFFPAGAGIQVNFSTETFLLLQAQYRFATGTWEPSHLYYSAGIAGVLGKKRNRFTRQRPLIPPASSPLSSTSKDKDGDGIVDSLDACPDIPGDAAAQGCPIKDTSHPILLSDIREKLKTNAQNIFFETDRYTLLPTSFKALDETALLLKTNPALHLLIEGHTDSTGHPEANQVLSRHRAEAVRSYLIQQGIEEKRLSAKGFGSSRPIADNNTPEGRSRNRRVELIPQE